ncbi:MAG TPA: hypothetical protein VLN26_17975 [Gaiellaceae bacterium]|nr:hypothetical protein [Gaiellaceae bacterium]
MTRWVAPLFGLAAAALVPWTVVLAKALPSAHTAAHWNVAWAGFDVALALLLLAVALAARRGSPWLEGAASASAALLFVDAWFDVLTAATRTELVAAVAEAGLVELPLAVLCVLLARRVERRLTLKAPDEQDAVAAAAVVVRRDPLDLEADRRVEGNRRLVHG